MEGEPAGNGHEPIPGTSALVEAIVLLERLYSSMPAQFERLRSVAELEKRHALVEFSRLPEDLQTALVAVLEIPDEARELAVRIVNLPAGAREPLRQLLDCDEPQLVPEPLPAVAEPVAVSDTVTS